MSNICVGCGMCCDGTMYRMVEVEEDEPHEALRSAGLTITKLKGTTSFRQPCSAFGTGCCSIYEDRPSVCRSYRCLLLRRHEAGEVSREDALALIAQTTDLRDRVRTGLLARVDPKEMENLDGLYRLMLAKFEAQPDPGSSRREHADFLLTVVALRVILAREFEPRDSKSHQADQAPDGGP